MWGLISAIYRALVNSVGITLGVFPTSADTVAAAAITLTSAAGAWTWGVWVEIVSAAGNPNKNEVYGLTLENFVGLLGQGEVQIGTGAGGAEAAIITVPTVGADQSFPVITVPPATRIAGRYRDSVAVANTVDVKLKVRAGA